MRHLTLLKIARMYRRLTLDELEEKIGEETGVGKHTFTRIENGNLSASEDTQEVLANVLELEQDGLFDSFGRARVIRWKHIRALNLQFN